MGDVKVASVTPAVMPMAAVAASASPVSTSARSAASDAVRDVEEERVGDEAVTLAEGKAEDVETAETTACSEEPQRDGAEEAVGAIQPARAVQSPAECSDGAAETVEKETISSGKELKEVALQPDTMLDREDAEEDGEAELAASGEGEEESDGVAVAPVAVGTLDPTSPSVTKAATKATASKATHKEEDDELVATTSVEEQSPEVICVDEDTQEDDGDGDGADTLGSELSAVDETTESLQSQQTPVRQRRKRARVLGFSSNRRTNQLKQKRLTVVSTTEDEAVVAPPTRARRQQSVESIALTASTADAAPAPSSTEAVTWDWNSCGVYFDPLTQASMDELSTIRRENAQVVAANFPLWEKMRACANNEVYLTGMVLDAGVDSTEDSDRFRLRPVNRGRFYRDAWEEEDFLLNQRKPTMAGRGSSKKRPFAGCEGVSTYRKLVRGFDDELFNKYVQQLEASARLKADMEKDEAQRGISAERIENSPPRRLKNVKRPAKDVDTLPLVPSSSLHPASCGSWKLKGKESPSFDSIHPASIRSSSLPQRWVEEMERATKQLSVVDESHERPRRSIRREVAKQGGEDEDGGEEENEKGEPEEDDQTVDELVELPSFGVVVDEDDVSREIDNSILRLLEVSALNWRRAQGVYERAVAHIEVTPLLLGEEAIKLRLENLYRGIFPPVTGDQDDSDDPPPRELKLSSKPKDIVAYAVKPCADTTEAVAVGASVEYAVRLKKGDAIDVLDRNGCWNDGVVIDLCMEAGVGLKFVLVSYALWGDDSSEWVSIADGRLLPRGVADGRVTFSFAGSRKKRVEMNKSVADLLQRTYPIRTSARAQLNAEKEEVVKQSSKKQRRQR